MPDDVLSVLIVEADQATRELYERELSRSFRVFVTAEGEQALCILRAESIQVVVLEPALPENRGWELLAALRAHDSTRTLPVVLCTALDERRHGMQLGANAYLIKPVSPDALHETIIHLLTTSPDDAKTALVRERSAQ